MKRFSGFLIVLCAPLFASCISEQGSRSKKVEVHVHADHGPRGGELFLFEGDEYHAEIVADHETEKVTLYILDKTAKEAVPVELQEPIMHIEIDGEEAEFKLTPVESSKTADGKVTAFEVTSAALADAIETKARDTAHLHVTFNGTELFGEIEAHDHHHGHGHSHDDGSADVLVWHVEQEALGGYQLQLGQHGLIIHAGEQLEPAAAITKNDEAVSDARVFVSVLDADGETVLADEVLTEFEPETEEEPAHYAGAKLDVPEDAEAVIIRYRIVLSGDGGEATFDSDRLATEKHDE